MGGTVSTMDEILKYEANHQNGDLTENVRSEVIETILYQRSLKLAQQAKTISEPHFYISAYFEENKDRYIDTMRQVSVTGDWNEWCLFFLEAVESQAISNLTIAENIRTLYEDKKKIFTEILSSKWAVTALDFVFTNPVFRNNKFTSQSGIPPATAARFTRAMIENNILLTLEEAAGRKPALYSFEPLLKLVRV